MFSTIHVTSDASIHGNGQNSQAFLSASMDNVKFLGECWNFQVIFCWHPWINRKAGCGAPPETADLCRLSTLSWLNMLGTPRPGTEVSRALRARNPKRVRKQSKSVSRGIKPQGAPESPKSAPCVFGLFSNSVAHSLLPEGPGRPFGFFADSFGIPGPKGTGDVCAWPGGSQSWLSKDKSARDSEETVPLVICCWALGALQFTAICVLVVSGQEPV